MILSQEMADSRRYWCEHLGHLWLLLMAAVAFFPQAQSLAPPTHGDLTHAGSDPVPQLSSSLYAPWQVYFNGVQYSLENNLMDDTIATMVSSKVMSWIISIIIQTAVWYFLWRLQRNPSKAALGYCPLDGCCGDGRCGQGSFYINWDDDDVCEYVEAVRKLDIHDAIELSNTHIQPPTQSLLQPETETYYAL
jgi:hypothetical protein